MTEKTEREQLKTPRARLSFPSLFEKRANDLGGEPRYEAQLIFDEAAQKDPRFQKMKEACARAATAAWPSKRPSGMRSPFRDGAEKEFAGYGPGTVYVTASTHRKCPTLREDRQEATPDDLYPGCYVVAIVSPYAYDKKGNKGVAFGLESIMKVADGEQLGGGGMTVQSARDAFADEEVEAPPSTGTEDAPHAQGGYSGPTTPRSVSEGMGIADDEIPF